MQNRRSHFQQHPDFHITSSTILASTLHITRLNNRNPPPINAAAPGLAMPTNPASEFSGLQEQPGNTNTDPLEMTGQEGDLQQPENGGNGPGPMNSFSSLLLWILGGASSEGLNSFLSMFRDARDQSQVYAESPRQDNTRTTTQAAR